MKIIKQELQFEECLKQRLEFICEFAKATPTFINGSIRKLEKTNLTYIEPHTPKQNGRVERSHRKDQERFYYKRVFYSLEDLRNQGKEWRKEYNNFPMRPLGWLSPREFIKKYKSQEESLFAI